MIKKNILLLLLCTTITIFGAQEKQILAIFRSLHDNKVIIQAGVAKHTMFRPQMDGQLQRVEEADCVYADLEPVVGLSIPAVADCMIKGQKYIDYNVSDHALFNNFHRYAYDRYYLLHASSLENAMQGYLEKTEVKDLAALTVMVKTLYKEEKMPVGLYNTWRQRFSSDQLSLLRENKQNQKEKFLNNYFPRDEDKETGQMVLDFVLCDNSSVKEVRQVCLSKKPTFSTNFFEFFINYKIPIFGLIVFIALGAGHQLGAF